MVGVEQKAVVVITEGAELTSEGRSVTRVRAVYYMSVIKSHLDYHNFVIGRKVGREVEQLSCFSAIFRVETPHFRAETWLFWLETWLF